MGAFSLSTALVCFWTFLGYAVLSALYRRGFLYKLLLAPTVGIATTLLPVFTLSRLGVPVGRFGLGLLVVLVLLAIVLLRRFHPVFSFSRALPFFLIFLLALVLTGRPMFEFGFRWLSYVNDDYANYILSATRFVSNGLYTLPDTQQFLYGKDYSLMYWFLYGVNGSRAGADMLLAWVMSITGLDGVAVFMPVILAFHISLISAAGAVVYQVRRYYPATVLVCLMVAMSALTSLGTLYQLIGQLLGLPLLCASAAVLLRPISSTRKWVAIRHGILLAILITALVLAYPELTPFLGLAFFLNVGLGILNRSWPESLTGLLYTYGVATVATLLLLNTYIITFLDFLITQTTSVAVSGVNNSIFPYLLVPSGLANLWGFQSIRAQLPEPLLSLAILLGMCLLLFSVICVLLTIKNRQPTVILTAVMLTFGGYLFIKQSGFALFKLTMYIQPFLIGTIVITWVYVISEFRFIKIVRVRQVHITNLALAFCVFIVTSSSFLLLGLHKRFIAIIVGETLVIAGYVYWPQIRTRLSRLQKRKRLIDISHLSILRKHDGQYDRLLFRVVPLLTLALLGLTGQFDYIAASRGTGSGLIEYTDAGKTVEEFSSLVSGGSITALRSDVASFPLAKILAAFSIGIPTEYISANYFIGIPSMATVNSHSSLKTQATALLNQYMPEDSVRHFNLFDSTIPAATFNVVLPLLRTVTASNDTSLVITSPQQTRFNLSQAGLFGTALITMRPVNQIRDYLIFVETQLGVNYYNHGPGTEVAFFQPQRDVAFPDSKMVSVGRYMMFEVINPTPSVRMRLNITEGYRNDGKNSLPPVEVVGDKRYAFPLIGRGSARVMSPPITPQLIDGHYYVMIDMGEPGHIVPIARPGLMSLYGNNIPLDNRSQVAFARDISLISSNDFDNQVPPPISLSGFPASLAAPELEYSGIYEDGWVSETSYFGLFQPEEKMNIVIRGSIPQVGSSSFTTNVTVSLDGQEIIQQPLSPGDFTIRTPVSTGKGKHRIEMHFSIWQSLPNGDNRPVSALLQWIGFQSIQ